LPFIVMPKDPESVSVTAHWFDRPESVIRLLPGSQSIPVDGRNLPFALPSE